MRRATRWGFLVVALALLAWALVSQWDGFVDALGSLTWVAVVAALAACTAALAVNALSWRAVMRAIGLDATLPEAMRVFLLSQVGKYVPGSVWPVLAQAEFAREHHVSRPRAMTGSIVAMVVGVVTAAAVGTAGLVLAVPGALASYWWVLVVAAALGGMLVPAVLERIVALAFRVTRREEQPARIGARPLLASALWSTLMWALLGLHAWLLLREIAPGTGPVLATGAFAFAWLVGFLVVIAPAGAGAREAALVLALGAVATPAQALSLAIVSRVLMTGADLLGFAAGVSLRRRRPPAAAPSPPAPPSGDGPGRTAAP